MVAELFVSGVSGELGAIKCSDEYFDKVRENNPG
jgi:hypothetical protein